MLRNGSRDHSDDGVARAREFRDKASASEKVLWEFLRKRRLGGFMFRRQYAVTPYFLDFYCYFLDFYCPEAKVCVEVDGEQHAGRAQRDAARDLFLERLGILTMRMPSLVLFERDGRDGMAFLARVEAACRERCGGPG